MRFRVLAFSVTIIAATAGGAGADPLQGGVQQAAPLQGGVQQATPLQPSVHVIPANAVKTNPLEGQALQQYSGGHFLPGGANQGSLQGGVNQPSLQGGVNTPGYTSYFGSHAVNQIPPTTTYTLTPHTGVLQFPGQTYSTPGTHQTGVMSFPGTSGYQPTESTMSDPTTYGGSYSTSGGVTTSSGYTISRTPVIPGTAAPGGASFSVYSRYGETKSGLTFAPGYEPHCEEIGGRLTYSTPGTQVGILTSRAGVSTYVPGYEVTVSTVGVEKETLGGVWSIPEIQPLKGVTGQLMAKKTLAQIFAPEVRPLIAKAELFPCLIPKTDKVTTWKLWYQRVAAAIYRRWQYSDVGPGTAVARVTVTRNKDISCQIIDFEPAPDTERNAAAETGFRETAMRAVNLVTAAEIPPFPPNAGEEQVRFDVNLRRRTTDVAGFDVASAGPK